MKVFSTFIKEHRFAILCASLFSLLMVAPLIVFPIVIGRDYQGINIANHGFDERWYLSRGKEALEGHALGNPLFREGKDGQDSYFTFVEYALVAPFRLLHLPIKITTVYAIYNTVGVFFLFLCLYFLINFFAHSRRIAVLGTLMVLGGYAAVNVSSLFSINLYSRAFSPYLPQLFFFLHLNILIRYLAQGTMRLAVLSMVTFGLLFYIYVYAWSFALTVLGVLLLLYLLTRNWTDIKRVSAVLAVGLGIGAYPLFLLYSFLSSPAYQHLSYFHWAENAHRPIIVPIILISLALSVSLWRRYEWKREFMWIPACAIAGLIVMNQQVVTGIVLQPDHYRLYFVAPLAIMFGVVFFWSYLKDEKQKMIAVGLVVSIVFAYTIATQYRATRTLLPLKREEQVYRPILDALNQDKTPRVVLTADNLTAYLFTIYTPHDLFWVRGFVPIDSIERMTDALFLYMYIDKDTRNAFRVSLLRSLGTDRGSWSKSHYQMIEGRRSGFDYTEYHRRAEMYDPIILAQRKKLIAELSIMYERVRRDPVWISSLLARYGVSYVVWNTKEQPSWDLSVIPRLATTTVSHGVVLYRISP